MVVSILMLGAIFTVGLIFVVILVISNQGGRADSGDQYAFKQQMQQRKMRNKLIAGLVILTVISLVVGMLLYFLMSKLPT